MTSRRESLKLASSALMTVCVLSINFCVVPRALAADEAVVADAGDGLISSSRRASTRPPATFFSINDVLAKLDRKQGRGPNALRMASLSPSDTATDAQPEQKEAPPVGKEPFGLFTFRAPEGILWRKWRGIEGDIAKEQVILNNCRTKADSCPSYVAQFLRLINAVKAQSGRGQLDEANRAVNMAIRYVSDFAQHGEADRWSAPLATFATGKGDCEDYAIAKYVALSEAGFPRDDLQLVLVRDRAVRQDHAVLAARLDGHWLILDSRRSELMDDSDATSFTPLFAIGHRGVQLFAAPYAKRPLLDDEVEAAPAAASSGDAREWGTLEVSSDRSSASGWLPLLM